MLLTATLTAMSDGEPLFVESGVPAVYRREEGVVDRGVTSIDLGVASMVISVDDVGNKRGGVSDTCEMLPTASELSIDSWELQQDSSAFSKSF